MKREIRRRCGFGCVVCGVPVYHYDHLHGWDPTRGHVADEITLLCGLHHDLKTRRLMTVEQAVAADASPYNCRDGRTTPFPLGFENSDGFVIALGGNTFAWPGPECAPIVVDNQPAFLFRRREKELLLNLDLRDQYNLPSMIVRDNEVAISLANWDVTFIANTLTLRRPAHKTFARIVFELPNKMLVEEAHVLMNGVSIKMDQNGIPVGEKKVAVRDSHFETPVALTVGYCPSFPRPPLSMLAMQLTRGNFSEDAGSA